MIINCLRPGAFGDVALTSAATYQLKNVGTICYYTKCPEVAALCEGVDFTIDSDLWNMRQKGIDIVFNMYPVAEGYPDVAPTNHLTYYACKIAGVVQDLPKLKSLPRIEEGDYITLQRKAGWSKYKEYSRWDEVIPHLPLPVIELTPDRTWRQSFSLVQHAALHLGIDSIFNHVAAAYKTPAVILFGSTSPILSGYPSAINLQHKMSCSPCFKETKGMSVHYRGECDHPCIDLIEPKEVLDAVQNHHGT